MSKATKREMLEREDDIQAKLKLGQDIGDFAQDLAEKHNCSKHSIERQYRVIINAMIELQKEDRAELKVKLMLRNDAIYKRVTEAKNSPFNPKLAMDSINLQAKIGGLYTPEKGEAAAEPIQPVFNFTHRDNSIPLAVVPEDDDDKAGNN